MSARKAVQLSNILHIKLYLNTEKETKYTYIIKTYFLLSFCIHTFALCVCCSYFEGLYSLQQLHG